MSRAGAALAAITLFAAAAAPVRGAPPPATGLERVAELPLALAAFAQPVAIAAAPLGRVFVADAGGGQVARVDSAGRILFAFEIPADQPALQPLDLEVTGFQVFVVDAQSAAVLRYSDRGQYLDVLRSFRDSASEMPRALAVDSAGRLLLAEPTRHRVRLVDEHQNIESFVGGFGHRPGELSRPLGVAFASDGSFWVADAGHSRLQHFTAVGNFAAAITDSLVEPRGLAVGAAGELFVADSRRESVHLFGPAGTHRAELRLPGRLPVDVSVVGDTLWILVTRPPALVRARVIRERPATE